MFLNEIIKRVGLDGRRSSEELGGVEVGENTIIIYYVGKIYFQ